MTKEIITFLENYNWPRGYGYYVSGELESREESFGGMGKAIIIAVIAILGVLIFQFKSFSQPLIIFSLTQQRFEHDCSFHYQETHYNRYEDFHVRYLQRNV